MLKAGHNLLLNQRRWHVRQVQPGRGRSVELEVIGTSAAAQGMTRSMTAFRYGDDLFIEQRHPRYWHGHLRHDWHEDDYDAYLQCRPATILDVLAAHTRHVALGDLKNSFSWSYSRNVKYQTCPRAYYYHYYAAWEGWEDDAPPPVKQAYLLKNLTDLPRWVGTLVHESLKFALARLKAGQPVTEADLLKQMRTRAQADFSDSKSGQYRQQPNQRVGFQEHYYDTLLPQTAWRETWTQAENLLKIFLRSSLYAHLRQQPADTFLDVETLQSFTVAGEKVWVQMDLARREGNRIYIYDWKTGHVEDEGILRRQLGIYGLYFRRARPDLLTPDTQLTGLVYALAEDRLLEFELDEPLLAETEAHIESGIAHLRGMLLDPLANLAALEKFPMIDDLTICRQCQFRELCDRAT